jgi:hypothetical protein
MTKFRLIGVAAALSSVLAGPAMARHVTAHPGPPAQSIYCATREAGNPHSRYCDYQAWLRSRGGSWDSRLDNACLRNPAYIPGECGLDAQGQALFPPSVR